MEVKLFEPYLIEDAIMLEERGEYFILHRDEATQLLVDLRDMADYKQRRGEFRKKFQSICDRYGKSAALMGRFRRAGLM